MTTIIIIIIIIISIIVVVVNVYDLVSKSLYIWLSFSERKTFLILKFYATCVSWIVDFSDVQIGFGHTLADLHFYDIDTFDSSCNMLIGEAIHGFFLFLLHE